MTPRHRKDNIIIDTLRSANSLLAFLNFRIANNLWAIYRGFIIKKIHLLHVLQALPGKALGFRYGHLQILTEIPIKSTSIYILGITGHDVSTERPVEVLHLTVYLRRSLNLAVAVSLF